ncbi:MAG: sigma-70 family RNA polymerase sigma factor [Terrisporobacter sp.]
MDFKEILYSIQKGENKNLLEFILEFESVINNLSKSLYYPESKTDLIIFIMELSKKINVKSYYDNEIIKFIFIRSLKNKQIDLFRKNILKNNCIYEINLDIISDYSSEFESNIWVEDIISNLSSTQKKILIESFMKRNSDIEIALELGISRQAVNKTKKRALKNLKKILEKDGVL